MSGLKWYQWCHQYCTCAACCLTRPTSTAVYRLDRYYRLFTDYAALPLSPRTTHRTISSHLPTAVDHPATMTALATRSTGTMSILFCPFGRVDRMQRNVPVPNYTIKHRETAKAASAAAQQSINQNNNSWLQSGCLNICGVHWHKAVIIWAWHKLTFVQSRDIAIRNRVAPRIIIVKVSISFQHNKLRGKTDNCKTLSWETGCQVSP